MKFSMQIPTRLRAGAKLSSGADVAQELSRVFGDLSRETFAILTLSAKNGLIAGHIISVGTLTGSLVHPREVFTPAILDSAAAIVLVHNHPSGDPTPSPEDREITQRLVDAGDILGIRVIDHIVAAEDRFYSFESYGVMPRPRKQ